jgi:uncharacterized phage protein (TIGR02218 family)
VRTLSAGLTAHLATRAHTRATMLLLALRNGTFLGVTDHDRDITYNLLGTPVTYRADTGILASDVSLTAGMEADNYEVTGPIADVVTQAEVLGGAYNRARAYLFQVNWKSLSDGAIKILAGNVSEARVEGGKFVFEIRSDFDRFNQVVGKVITNNCPHDFGDANCGVVPESTTLTVTSVTDAMRFTGTFTGGPFANDYFNLGTCEPLAGVNAGADKIEIIDWTSGGLVELFMPLAQEPEIGDTFTIKTGCSKARKSDDPTVRTCLSYDNVVNFGGFPEVPGSDQVLKPTIPGQGNDD